MNTTFCKTEGCGNFTTGKSKYCREHAAVARAAWREMISQKGAAREVLQAGFATIVANADAAGRAAAAACVPHPMIVRPGAITVNGAPVSGETYYVPDGVCGFAWVNVTPGTSSFARYLKARGLASKAYGGGVQIWVSDYNQSMERKEAYARAYAHVLQAAGIQAYSGSRMD